MVDAPEGRGDKRDLLANAAMLLRELTSARATPTKDGVTIGTIDTTCHAHCNFGLNAAVTTYVCEGVFAAASTYVLSRTSAMRASAALARCECV